MEEKQGGLGKPLFPPDSNDVRVIGAAAASYVGLKGEWRLSMHKEAPRLVTARLMKVVCLIVPEVAVQLELEVVESKECVELDFTRVELLKLV